MSIGSYFGDEEGFDCDIKSCSARANDYDCLLLKISKLKIKQNTMYETGLQQDIQRAANSKSQIFHQKTDHLKKISDNMDSMLSNPKVAKQLADRAPVFKLPPLPSISSRMLLINTAPAVGAVHLDDFKEKGILHAPDSETIAQKLKKSNVEIQGVISGNEQAGTVDSKIDQFQKDFADSMLSEKQRQKLQKKTQFAQLLMQHKNEKVLSARSHQVESFLTNTRDEDEVKRLDVSVSNSLLDKSPIRDPKLRFLKRALQVSKSAMNLHSNPDSILKQPSEANDSLVHDNSSSVLLPSIKKSSNQTPSKKSLVVHSERYRSNEPIRKEASLFQRNAKKNPTDVFVEGSYWLGSSALGAADVDHKIRVHRIGFAASKDSVEGRGSARAIDLDDLLNKNLALPMHRMHYNSKLRDNVMQDRKAISFRSIPTEPNDSHLEVTNINPRMGEKIKGSSTLMESMGAGLGKEANRSMLAPPKVASRKPFFVKQSSAQDVLISRN